ncbi:electron-transferring-flavoprotein dehydrogenase [Rhodospirillum rubrum F11]|uniref:Electron transfer flavoprotein-ubiquinone oxidoreductase n=1 Tax=Rhodospirillum rubrum (strain ATCC 11170 / ATH 1.1.1 / DSM 467 / LMG 4362 / NCIMB 8255 / S1) TaxID=269796 RepID=Q2RUS7_RHORT|nr:electron transfer flavoprotein-ubiquinone oxidoreductase [Rhodospirillum rubrum]ABC22118.1 Electron-transferring-flavoprotein dehydrogenase [Rhodospirillum rubrum ATCC 11170]AEO47832.1 electron-transferring-flavoprotein dehydrogenase [Rhodospirillum rubrum F11]MBK5953707.1 electron-transferring-flavoprotein dehydrogenase [Rhodospirillum rubrum]QXG81767.1 electron transfer flavoprotein-ubiquinone oxidoreductase [Rhodospirillum rubrum]
MDRETMSFDVVVVGGGPSGLASAIRLKQLRPDTSVCLIEKGAEIGAHILSGAVIEPRALDELLPDWAESAERGEAPFDCPAREDRLLLLTRRRAFRLPLPREMNNHGNYIVSLGVLCRWLAARAEALGVEIFPGFAAAEVLYDGTGAVCGVATGDMGVGRDGRPTAAHTPGVALLARQTLFAEGCRGSLSAQLGDRFALRRACDPQAYGLGLKELWEIPAENHQPGLILHTAGWPLPSDTYGGSFLYHLGTNQVAVGYVVALDYANPYLSPFEEFQRHKTHPAIADHLRGGRRIAYGARALSEGGLQSLPQLTFPGGALIGDTAGFLNVPKIKGTHAAMKSAMLAAEAVVRALDEGRVEALGYTPAFAASWLHKELHAVRNVRPSFRWGRWAGFAYAGLESVVLRGKAPWTLRNRADHLHLGKAADHRPIDYAKPDGVLTFDRLSSVYLSNTNHVEDQPCHLRLKDPEVAIATNLAVFDAPEQRYCPAGVYEVVREGAAEPRLQINAQNCLHCKTCDIKDPTQNIVWTVPEGGGGPAYSAM